ncbi:MAG: 16S rRNA (guanine(527)-N(7))-methyltransferase RsmG [Rhizobiaceae bacterium]|nr:MAG: 16S rRNA (guanine(527)-N(7))-methyltransferase RsmG [Rhizobiaceae bacterium]CAG1012835.1 Ribosomal RNA small subunit methyltransferase G [Rhizobiaceae bacterium]
MKTTDFDCLREVAGPVSRETYERLKEFQQSFTKWNARINLVAASTLNELWSRHILDSAQLVRLAPNELRWLDLGSGGGFPGAVMAILLRERPGAKIDLIESNRKKAAFLQSTVGGNGIAIVHAHRIEDVVGLVSAPQVVTARALAPLPKLLDLASPWLLAGARGLFHKGRDYRIELEESADHWRFDLIEHKSRINPEGVILDIRNLKSSRPAAGE